MFPFHDSPSRQLRKLPPKRLSRRVSSIVIRLILYSCLVVYALVMLMLGIRVGQVDVKEDSTSNNDLTTLVIMIGSLRGGEPTWQTAYANLLNNNKADLALVIGQTDDHTTSSLYKRASYLYEFPEYGDDWSDAIDLIDGPGWRNSVLPNVASKYNWSGFMGGVAGIGGSGAIHFMARYFAQQLILSEGLEKKYDRFVITRADHYYQCPHSLDKLDNRFVWVPKGEDYGGICDRHVVCNSSQVMQVLNVLPSLIKDPDLYNAASGALRNTKPEEFLKLYWNTVADIYPKRFDRVMFTLMQDGVDTTRGRTASQEYSIDVGLEEQGLRVKYPNEYYASQCTCSTEESGRKYQQVFWSSHGMCLADNELNRLVFDI